MQELAKALAFERRVHASGARQRIELAHGIVVLHPGLPTVYQLNALILDAPLAAGIDAAAITRLADEHLGHLPHRQVVLQDAPAATRLAPDFLRAGWTKQRTVFMALRRERVLQVPADPRAREISEPELRKLQHELYWEEHGGEGPSKDALIAALVAGQDELRAGTPARCFGAGEDGELLASCTLFCERPAGAGGTAMLEDVGTRLAHRRHGLGRAVVTVARDAAMASGCDPILIPADADDWPQRLYAQLGFEPIGMELSFTRAKT